MAKHIQQQRQKLLKSKSVYDSGAPSISLKLLSTNTKLSKMNNDYLVAGLSLAPHKLSGYNVCPAASSECSKLCINYSGHARVFPKIIQGRINKTKLLYENQFTFLKMLHNDLSKLDSILYSIHNKDGIYNVSLFKNFKPTKIAIRLNVFSDLPWESLDSSLFSMYSHFQFYDYTKIPKRYKKFLDGKMPPNYHLTFSRSETNDKDCLYFLENYDNAQIAMVFKGIKKDDAMPPIYNGTLGKHNLHDGDLHDLRFLDGPGIIGLRAKSLAKSHPNSPFLVQIK